MIENKTIPDAPAPDLRAAVERLTKWFDASGSSISARWERISPEERSAIVRGMQAALRAERDEAQPVAWQSITSAPSDGCKVWVRGGRHKEPEIVEADGSWWRAHLYSGSPTEWAYAHPPATSPGAPVCKDCTELFGEPVPCAVPYDAPPKADSSGAAGVDRVRALETALRDMLVYADAGKWRVLPDKIRTALQSAAP
jgi:hypothetical protein